MEKFKWLGLYSMFLSLISMSSSRLDMITPNQPIRDTTKNQNETLVSTNGTFEAGFFSPAENSRSRYVGIWYKNIFPRTVVWVANRETPLSDRSGVLELDSEGNLRILDGTGLKIWYSNALKKAEKSVMVQLLESGNMVVKDGHNNYILWQSFDYPADTILPGMKIGSNIKTGQNWTLRSWKSLEDPTPGNFSFHVDIRGLPQLVITQEGTTIYRPGSWNGISITGLPEEINDQFVRSIFVINREEVFYEINSSIIIFMRSRLTPDGYQVRLIWSDQTHSWVVKNLGSFDHCERYALCGANTNCEAEGSEQHCECLIGYKNNSADSAGKLSGCVRITTTTQEDCNNKGDSFHKYEGMKLPDTSSAWYNKTVSLQEECEKLCLNNCSCTAYAQLNISGTGSGCLHWFSDIVDMRKLPKGGQDFYLRVVTSAPELDHGFNKKKLAEIVVGCTIFIIVITVCGLRLLCIRKKKLMQPETIYRNDKSENGDIDLPTFDFLAISNATSHFAQINKLGQGGFGPVYKGILADGQEIAVKRLSKTSRQGLEESC